MRLHANECLLTQQLNFVMSVFVIEDGAMMNCGLVATIRNSTDIDWRGDSSVSHMNAVSDANGNADVGQEVCQHLRIFYINVNAMSSAVNSEQQKQKSRAMSFVVYVVYGLPDRSDGYDKIAVENLCHKELNAQTYIQSFCRLGRSTDRRIQPILVTVHTAEKATLLIYQRLCTRLLIRWWNSTKAQSAADYKLQCQSRGRQQDTFKQLPVISIVSIVSQRQLLVILVELSSD